MSTVEVVKEWKVAGDIDIELIRRGQGINEACTIIDRKDLWENYLFFNKVSNMVEASSDHPGRFDDIINEIIEAIDGINQNLPEQEVVA